MHVGWGGGGGISPLFREWRPLKSPVVVLAQLSKSFIIWSKINRHYMMAAYPRQKLIRKLLNNLTT